MCKGDSITFTKPEAPRVPRPDSEEQPLSAEETAGFGDPFKEHGLPDPPPRVKTVEEIGILDNVRFVEINRGIRHENAAGKKLCGMCVHKVSNSWWCTQHMPIPSTKNQGHYPCPAPNGECPGFSSKKAHRPTPSQPKKKGLPVPPGVKFLYVGAPRGKTKRGMPQHQGVVTVAWITPAPGVLHLGFSFCSPKDPWCKAKGRDMALARLLKRTGPTIILPFLYDAKRTVREVVRAVLSHDFGRLEPFCPGTTAWGHIKVPSWTKGLAMRVKVPPVPAHAADAVTYLLSGLYPPGGIGLIFKRPKPTAPQIVAMMRDIAALGND